ncbi:UDP-glycosyltransferase 73C5-like [Mercurialis annua]|uniref:UDP-glycosyltransferase 73C5-like n=1 Tax=Mercurialis annua TaxID=3986 RepID=UPI0024AFAB9A|nr:UDP-glycosyltransferase 73C5-like [Mercurialis annua]
MASNPNSQTLHFILFPFMAQGHTIPMIDIAKMLAQHGMIVTIITTPLNAKRFETTVTRAVISGLQIRLIELEFPTEAAGLPKDCENCDMLPSLALGSKFFSATIRLKEPVERLLEEQVTPKPDCIISDMCLPYTAQVATKLGVPRISFNGSSCFCMLCLHKIYNSKVLENIKSDSEYFVVPELPHHIELTKDQLPAAMIDSGDFEQQIAAAETVTHGMIINSFQEMEAAYVQEYKKVRNDKVWCIGPVSLYNKDKSDKIERGDKASIQESECMDFLNSQNPNSVLYVCFGSLCNLITSQLIELALGLEASRKPFIWVIGREKGLYFKEIEKWIKENNFEERNKGKGLIIRGWAPQVVILSHLSIGGFLTHCGWNSTLEGISAGIPMVTWPLFADQFSNERLVVDVLKIGVKVGAEVTIKWGEEEKIGVVVKSENVKKAIEKLMDEEEDSEERRRRAIELGKLAREAIEENGSSYLNMKLLIQDIMHHKV